eukprot:151011_1
MLNIFLNLIFIPTITHGLQTQFYGGPGGYPDPVEYLHQGRISGVATWGIDNQFVGLTIQSITSDQSTITFPVMGSNNQMSIQCSSFTLQPNEYIDGYRVKWKSGTFSVVSFLGFHTSNGEKHKCNANTYTNDTGWIINSSLYLIGISTHAANVIDSISFQFNVTTQNPTQTPTKNPTQTPTQNPTLNPTITPTLNPTNTPTYIPTIIPTLSPTLQPSITPTGHHENGEVFSITTTNSINEHISSNKYRAGGNNEGFWIFFYIVFVILCCLIAICVYLLKKKQLLIFDRDKFRLKNDTSKKIVKMNSISSAEIELNTGMNVQSEFIVNGNDDDDIIISDDIVIDENNVVTTPISGTTDMGFGTKGEYKNVIDDQVDEIYNEQNEINDEDVLIDVNQVGITPGVNDEIDNESDEIEDQVDEIKNEDEYDDDEKFVSDVNEIGITMGINDVVADVEGNQHHNDIALIDDITIT